MTIVLVGAWNVRKNDGYRFHAVRIVRYVETSNDDDVVAVL